jgi:hypothetical protein
MAQGRQGNGAYRSKSGFCFQHSAQASQQKLDHTEQYLCCCDSNTSISTGKLELSE